MQKRIAVLTLIAVLGLLLSACAPEGKKFAPTIWTDDDSSSSQPEGSAPQATPAAQSDLADHGTIVPVAGWTEPLLDNMMIENAIQIRPAKPFESHQLTPAGQNLVYQLKSTFIDTDLSTWKPGELVEFDLALGWRPILIGVQGDAYTSLCWQTEDDRGTQVLVKLDGSNGGSALVVFIKTDEKPEIGQLCP